MKYTIKQAVLSDSQVSEVNSTSTYPDYYKEYLDVISRPTQALINKARYLYQTVGFIKAENPNDVFHKGNVWDGFEDDIEHTGVGMHSISIGDLLIDESNKCVVVNRTGFTEIQLKEEGFSNYK